MDCREITGPSWRRERGRRIAGPISRTQTAHDIVPPPSRRVYGMSALGVQSHLPTHRTFGNTRQPLRSVPSVRGKQGTAFRMILESRGTADSENRPKDIRSPGFCLVGEYVTLAPAILDTGHGCEVRRCPACYTTQYGEGGELTRVRAVLTPCALFWSTYWLSTGRRPGYCGNASCRARFGVLLSSRSRLFRHSAAFSHQGGGAISAYYVLWLGDCRFRRAEASLGKSGEAGGKRRG